MLGEPRVGSTVSICSVARLLRGRIPYLYNPPRNHCRSAPRDLLVKATIRKRPNGRFAITTLIRSCPAPTIRKPRHQLKPEAICGFLRAVERPTKCERRLRRSRVHLSRDIALGELVPE